MDRASIIKQRAVSNTRTVAILEGLPGVSPDHVAALRKITRRRGDGGPDPALALDTAAHTAEIIAALAEHARDLEERLAELESL